MISNGNRSNGNRSNETVPMKRIKNLYMIIIKTPYKYYIKYTL